MTPKFPMSSISPISMSRNDRNRLPLVLVIIFGFAFAATQLLVIGRGHVAQAANATSSQPQHSDDPVLAKAYRFERGGWIYVHLEGSPHDVGYQHGWLLSAEIADAFQSVRLYATHSSQRDWDFFRRAAREMLWPKIDDEYKAELHGIVDALAAKKIKLDLDDIVAMNAFLELPDYYVPWLNEKTQGANLNPDAPKDSGPGHCSAFVANGSWTKDHQIVMAHNNWTNYATASAGRLFSTSSRSRAFAC
jgi:hypothetical protein